MTIHVGEKIPDIDMMVMTEEGPKPFSLSSACEGKRVVLFAVPGAFTPTCSARHLPGYVDAMDDFLDKGIDAVFCLSVNDVFVMSAWGESQDASRLTMLADGAATYTRALGLEVDLTNFGMGMRSQRYAMLIEDGVLTHLNVESGPGLDVSSAESLLEIT